MFPCSKWESGGSSICGHLRESKSLQTLQPIWRCSVLRAKPLPRAGRDLWIGNDAIIGGFDRLLPRTRRLV